eukprot:CAMPEP_0197256074 /NCGR_PEP_ID=MMETSP1429-20130617/74131_1 /TAXON_ID=49237 /ORGANISM="Chaetoceros  sp., Strain UNC1202" /LENGTH=75 /DNA_ID=CAMNT_0042719533 /DNA_START=37 /DNA_END=261 /DNA_ORIENTATION=-
MIQRWQTVGIGLGAVNAGTIGAAQLFDAVDVVVVMMGQQNGIEAPAALAEGSFDRGGFGRINQGGAAALGLMQKI